MVTTYVLPALVFGAVGLVAGVLLTVCSKVFEVRTDERIEAINEALPQVNCGSCGFSGCSDYANAIVNNGAPANLCKPGGKECASKIAALMGMESGDVSIQTAVVKCSGHFGNTSDKFKYDGIQSCKAANRFYSGSTACTHGCLAFGDCAAVCPQKAISIVNGLARVDRAKCIGCGLCAKTCPNQIIIITDIANHVEVCCSSTELGKDVRSVCKGGCIGCKKCEKTCEHGAITVENNLARIDHSKCTSCGKCAEVCPVHAIRKCDVPPELK
ncbi:MAG: RnfABCDGE type electron transport complex subunit B [Oscillospiraceae bacterium]|nr:RnfABCDGE type electron transport complex subunit B [Oscillospiraceae bacterium]